MVGNSSTIDDYIGTFPPEVQDVLIAIRSRLHEAVPGMTEAMSYGMPTLKLDGKSLVHFAGLAAVAGAPAIIGTWIGAFTYSPLWTTVFLAIGIGAIAQVIWEVGRLIQRSQARAGEPLFTWNTLGGITAGIAVMYGTALLV